MQKPARCRGHDRLVIAAQADDLSRPRALQVAQQLDDGAAVRPAVDIVADEQEARRVTGAAALAMTEQLLELADLPVHVADRTGQHGLPGVALAIGCAGVG